MQSGSRKFWINLSNSWEVCAVMCRVLVILKANANLHTHTFLSKLIDRQTNATWLHSTDRYWAITDPITYPSRMTPSKASLFIFGLWMCSALISFPAIVWWRAVQKVSDYFFHSTNHCVIAKFCSIYYYWFAYLEIKLLRSKTSPFAHVFLVVNFSVANRELVIFLLLIIMCLD